MKFGSLYKIRTFEKNTFFDSTFSVLLLLSHGNDIFWRKKKTHSNLILVLTEKIAAQKYVVRNFAEGKTSTHFWPLSSLYLPEESILEFRVYDSLSSTHRDLSGLQASKLFAEPFSRNPGKRGSHKTCTTIRL